MGRYNLRIMKFLISLGLIYQDCISGSYFDKNTITINPNNRRVENQIKRLVESSEILLFVMDSRNPIGGYFDIRKIVSNNKFEIIVILNKSDKVSKFIIKIWKRAFSKIFNVISVNSNATSKKAGEKLMNSIKKLGSTVKKRTKTINIGIIGTANVGKSSLANFLLKKSIAKVSKIPGDTISWQFYRINRFFYLIDSPGIRFANVQENNKLSTYTRLVLDRKNIIGKRNKESKKKEPPLELLKVFYENILKGWKLKNSRSEIKSRISNNNVLLNLDFISNLETKSRPSEFSPLLRLNSEKRKLNSIFWKRIFFNEKILPS